MTEANLGRRELLAGGMAWAFSSLAGAQQSKPAKGGTGPPIWGPPYTRRELKDAQRRFGLRFPPDLYDSLLKRRFIHGPDWIGDEASVRENLAWPLQGILHDIRENDFWPAYWGVPDPSLEARIAKAEGLVAAAPRLIPLAMDMFIPEQPMERGNPVFFVFLGDVRYYAADVNDFAMRISNPGVRRPVTGARKHIPFWSELSQLKTTLPKPR